MSFTCHSKSRDPTFKIRHSIIIFQFSGDCCLTVYPQFFGTSTLPVRGVATCTHGRTCVPEKIGSLRNDYGHAYGYGNKCATKQYGLMSKPMVCTCVMTSGTYTFICRTPQNNNVKLMTKFKFYRVRGTRDGDLLILCLNLNVIPTNYVPIYR